MHTSRQFWSGGTLKMIDLKYADKNLYINNRLVTLDYPIKEAFTLSDKIIVLSDPDSNLGKDGQFKNLICLDKRGNIVWVAEMPTDKNSDVYYKISKRNPLTVYSFCSFECEIDIKNGTIKRKIFFK